MKKKNKINFVITTFILCYLIFFEYITISIKDAVGIEFIGAARDCLLILIASWGIFKYRRSSVYLYFIILAAYSISLLILEARPFANLVSAFVIGATVRVETRPYSAILFSLIIVCVITVIYQAASITDFNQFWFYNYLNNKEGDLFIATQYAYFRGDNVRPTGIMISPSVMGLALISLGYIYKTSIQPLKKPYLIHGIIFICLLLIQTRVLILGYVFYVFMEMNAHRISAKNIAFLYIGITAVTLFAINYVGDESAYVRILLLNSVFNYLSNGILFPYLQADQAITVDSQLVGFFYLTGIAGLISLAFLYGKAFMFAKSPAELISFNFISFCIFISVFQWSYDSFGMLTCMYVLGWLVSAGSAALGSLKKLPIKHVLKNNHA